MSVDARKAAVLAEIPRLRRYARALLRDGDRADDLVQDCLERALRRLDNWMEGESPRRWLFTIMHNLFVDQMRRKGRRPEGAMLPLDHAEALAAPAEQAELVGAREVLNALQAISPERRAALLAVAVEGFSYAEAAAMLGVPAGTLMSRVARGRDDLRALLDDAGRRRMIRVIET
jgi:RNA polymerase sigma-70 factor (ECF subfamily)